jgi:hypothetical protein
VVAAVLAREPLRRDELDDRIKVASGFAGVEPLLTVSVLRDVKEYFPLPRLHFRRKVTRERLAKCHIEDLHDGTMNPCVLKVTLKICCPSRFSYAARNQFNDADVKYY